MLPSGITMSSPVNDAHNVSDDRIPVQQRDRIVQYRTTADGDVVVVQPSFDDDNRKTPTHSPIKEWQARSPADDAKDADNEARNPSSPGLESASRQRHNRNLSAHFFESTSISDNNPVVPKDDDEGGRKHRRMFSGDVSNPSTAHRRINSRGKAANIQREPTRQSHRREDSAGLDILSAAVDVTKDELSEAVGPPSSTIAPWDPPTNHHLRSSNRPSIGHVSTGSYEHQQQQQQHAYPGHEHHGSSMAPPHRRIASGIYPQQHPAYIPTAPYQGYPPPHFYYPPYPPGGVQEYPGQFSQPPPPNMMHKQGNNSMYPSQESRRPQDRYHDDPQDRSRDERMYSARNDSLAAQQRQWPTATQGSQTFVTGLAVDAGSKTMVANETAALPNAVPSQVGHHRKLSSFSSLGTILGTSMFQPGSAPEAERRGAAPGHHRKSSSTVSFLQDFDVGLESTDAAFLRNLQASNSSVATGYGLQAMMAKQASPPRGGRSSTFSDSSSHSGTKLAAGGTSKRVRRKCNIANCPNRVVQGGLCISHGAKRKTCRHEGCDKNVKKAGLCSTHGPARKRCEAGSCQKVAVQGGRCIAHGAKKKLCAIDDCAKQAILSGMCKKHHDQANGITRGRSSSSEEDEDELVCAQIKPAATAGQRKKSSHTRGLSIFQELSADAVSSMLNDPP
jgi:hypothetical protein